MARKLTWSEAADLYEQATLRTKNKQQRKQAGVDDAINYLDLFRNSVRGKDAQELLLKSGREIKIGKDSNHTVVLTAKGFQLFSTNNQKLSANTATIVTAFMGSAKRKPRDIASWLCRKLDRIAAKAPR